MPDVSDPYGIDVAIDATGDVVVTPSGDLGTIDGPQNCVQALRARMHTYPGELTLHPDYGSTFGELIGRKYALPVIKGAATAEVRRITEQDSRFLGAGDVEAHAVDGRDTSARVSVGLILSAGETIEVSDLANPGVDEAISPDAAELADLETVTDFEDFDYLAQDDAELDELRDAAELADFLAPPSTDNQGE